MSMMGWNICTATITKMITTHTIIKNRIHLRYFNSHSHKQEEIEHEHAWMFIIDIDIITQCQTRLKAVAEFPLEASITTADRELIT